MIMQKPKDMWQHEITPLQHTLIMGRMDVVQVSLSGLARRKQQICGKTAIDSLFGKLVGLQIDTNQDCRKILDLDMVG